MARVDDQLKFMVAFAEASIGEYRPGDWENLRDDLDMFLSDGRRPGETGGDKVAAGGEAYMSTDWASDYSETDLRGLQFELHTFLEWCVQDREDHLANFKGFYRMDVSVGLTGFISGDALTGLVIGPIRDLVLFKSYQLLRRKSVRPIQRCPVCDRLFYRVRKQQYCQRACFTKAWVKTQKGKSLKKTADKKSAKKRRLDKAKKQWAKTATPRAAQKRRGR